MIPPPSTTVQTPVQRPLRPAPQTNFSSDAILAAQIQAEQLPNDMMMLMTPRTFDDFQIAFAMSLSMAEQVVIPSIPQSHHSNHDADMSYESLVQLEDVKVGLAKSLRDHIPQVHYSVHAVKNEYVALFA